MLRDLGLRICCAPPRSARYIAEMRFKPPQRYTAGLIWADGARILCSARCCPKPLVLDAADTSIHSTRCWSLVLGHRD